MSSINQIRANRLNAQHSTGPKTQEGKDSVRFNALTHGLRANSTLIPGDDPDRFEQHLQSLLCAWNPIDDMETSLVEQIASAQWKAARLNRAEARIYGDETLNTKDFALALHRLTLIIARMERSVSQAIADMERYRKERTGRAEEVKKTNHVRIAQGLVWTNKGHRTYKALPEILGIDGIWRKIPPDLLGDPDCDFSQVCNFHNPPPGYKPEKKVSPDPDPDTDPSY